MLFRTRTLLLLIFAFGCVVASRGAETEAEASAPAPAVKSQRGPAVVHNRVGDTSRGVEGRIRLKAVAKKQQYSAAMKDSWDTDINSPKSVTYHPDGSRFYVNSLEGCKTVVYDANTFRKMKVIDYDFSAKDLEKTAPLSGYYKFTHYADGERRAYRGKPVESTWSHSGRYLWVPFYRRTFDINAQDPSAIAVIDSHNDSIVRIFETGPLPKMVATSNDGRTIAVTHWGDNTVGFIDIAGDSPEKWHHMEPVTIGNKLNLNYSLTTPVNRDSGSGFLLRGTVFTPDDRYLLVSGMAGPLQVVDMESRRHIGSVPNLQSIRHLEIKDNKLYGSQNTAATVLKVDMDTLLNAIERARAASSRNIAVAPADIRRVKVGGGARTLCISPDGAYAFVACNSGNALFVVDTETMKVVDSIACDSYPVGLTLSADGHRAIVTSQGRSGGGGNAVNIFDVERFGSDSEFLKQLEGQTGDEGSVTDDTGTAAPDNISSDASNESADSNAGVFLIWIVVGVAVIVAVAVIWALRRK